MHRTFFYVKCIRRIFTFGIRILEFACRGNALQLLSLPAGVIGIPLSIEDSWNAALVVLSSKLRPTESKACPEQGRTGPAAALLKSCNQLLTQGTGGRLTTDDQRLPGWQDQVPVLLLLGPKFSLHIITPFRRTIIVE